MKWIAVALLGLTAAAYGQSPGPSAGVSLGTTFDSLSYQVDGTLSPSPQKQEATLNMSFVTVGGFVDFTYVEASLGLLVQLGTQSTKIVDSSSGTSDQDLDTRFVNLDARLLGKYPLRFLHSLWFFPLVGLEYSHNLSRQNKQDFLRSDELNDLFLDAGAGIDFPVNGSTYVRAEGIYGLNLTPSSQDVKDMASSGGGFYGDYGSRLNFSIGLGSRF